MNVDESEIELRKNEVKVMRGLSLIETVVKFGYDIGLLHGDGHPTLVRLQELEGHLAIVALATQMGIDFEERHINTDWEEADFIIEANDFLEEQLKSLG